MFWQLFRAHFASHTKVGYSDRDRVRLSLRTQRTRRLGDALPARHFYIAYICTPAKRSKRNANFTAHEHIIIDTSRVSDAHERAVFYFKTDATHTLGSFYLCACDKTHALACVGMWDKILMTHNPLNTPKIATIYCRSERAHFWFRPLLIDATRVLRVKSHAYACVYADVDGRVAHIVDSFINQIRSERMRRRRLTQFHLEYLKYTRDSGWKRAIDVFTDKYDCGRNQRITQSICAVFEYNAFYIVFSKFIFITHFTHCI